MRCLLLFLALVSVGCVATRQQVRVLKVADGDTFTVEPLGGGEAFKVRLAGVDCPESHNNAKCRREAEAGRPGCAWQIPHGKRAAQYAVKMLLDTTVTLECDGGCEEGAFGRALRYVVMQDGRDFGRRLIELGLCEDFSYKYPHGRARLYKRAQTEARAKHNGIWNR